MCVYKRTEAYICIYEGTEAYIYMYVSICVYIHKYIYSNFIHQCPPSLKTTAVKCVTRREGSVGQVNLDLTSHSGSMSHIRNPSTGENGEPLWLAG